MNFVVEFYCIGEWVYSSCSTDSEDLECRGAQTLEELREKITQHGAFSSYRFRLKDGPNSAYWHFLGVKLGIGFATERFLVTHANGDRERFAALSSAVEYINLLSTANGNTVEVSDLLTGAITRATPAHSYEMLAFNLGISNREETIRQDEYLAILTSLAQESDMPRAQVRTSTGDRTMPTTPAPDMPSDALATLNVTRQKSTGKLILSVNAKPLHDLLDSFGVERDSFGYKNRPSGQAAIASRNKLSTEPLLVRSYPNEISIGGLYDHPPTLKELTQLCHSAEAAIRLIITHYQPIDIRVRINKVLK